MIVYLYLLLIVRSLHGGEITDDDTNVVQSDTGYETDYDYNAEDIENLEIKPKDDHLDEEDCWMNLDAASHFKIMDKLDDQYRDVRQKFHDSMAEELDRNMLDAILTNQGAAYRALHKTKGEANLIPAGLNLGGYTMMKLRDSVLFFHRTKLRNDTHFRVNLLNTDLMNMSMVVRLSMNDLHIIGAYERCTTYHDFNVLYHTPAYGEIGILMKNVGYKMEGRLRTIHDRLILETIDSDFIIKDDILLTYLFMNDTSTTIQIKPRHIEDFLERMKTDFDLWLKDYFNDYFMYFKLNKVDPEFEAYDKARTMALNEYTDFAINKLQRRLVELGAVNAVAPNFTIYSVPNLQIILTNGVIRGLDSMYRRSVATGKKFKNIRHVDALVGFSDLKVEYKFDATLPVGIPPLVGHIFLTADELTTHMEISMVHDPESVDLKFDFMQQLKPESLTVEGPANRLIASYKHILETQIMSIMTSTLIYNIRMLATLPRCRPSIFGYEEPQDVNSVEGSVTRNSQEPDYVLFKNDSVELSMPDPMDPSKSKRVELKRQEKFSFKNLDRKKK